MLIGLLVFHYNLMSIWPVHAAICAAWRQSLLHNMQLFLIGKCADTMNSTILVLLTDWTEKESKQSSYILDGQAYIGYAI